jgi:hypothetical protein
VIQGGAGIIIITISAGIIIITISINQSINLPRDQGQPPWLAYTSMGT